MIFKTKRIKVNGSTLDQVLNDKIVEDSDDDEEEETEEGQWAGDDAKPANSKAPQQERHHHSPTKGRPCCFKQSLFFTFDAAWR